MRINTAIIISTIVLLFGVVFGKPYLWVPISVLSAGVIDLLTRKWITSDRFGRAVTLSVLLKFLFALIGLYAMLGQVACMAVLIIWFVF